MQHRVLITGSAGRLGRVAVAALLARGHDVRGYDVRPTPKLDASQQTVGSLDDADALAAAMAGGATLIHLAATPDDAEFPPRGQDNFVADLVPNNIVGPYRVLEAARRANVSRVMLASTGQVIDGHLRAGKLPVSALSLPEPRYLYACTKVFLEALGRVYAEQHGLRVFAVRFGWCPRDLKQVAEIRASAAAQDVYLSPGDAGRFFVAAVETPAWPEYAILYATSRHTHEWKYDLSDAEKLIGYVPQEQWPTGAEAFD